MQTLNWVLVCRFRPVLRQLRELISAWTGLFECLRGSIAVGYVWFVLLVGYEHFLLTQRIHNNATERAIRHQGFEFHRSPACVVSGSRDPSARFSSSGSNLAVLLWQMKKPRLSLWRYPGHASRIRPESPVALVAFRSDSATRLGPTGSISSAVRAKQYTGPTSPCFARPRRGVIRIDLKPRSERKCRTTTLASKNF